MARTKHEVPIELIADEETIDHQKAEVRLAVQHHLKTGKNPLDMVQIKDEATGEYLPIEQVIAQYRNSPAGPGGAPGIYNQDFHPRAAFLLCAEHGAQCDQLATHFGVSLGTIRAWMWRHFEFAEAVKHGWDYYMTQTAERALVQRATGFDYEEVKRARVPIYDTVTNDKGTPHKVIVGYEEVVVERVTKRQAPDVTALMFLLQNRHGERWRNVRKVEHTARVEHAIPGTTRNDTPAQVVPQLSTAELEAVAAAALRLGLLPGHATDAMEAEPVEAEAQGAQGTTTQAE